jgi:hypothetical protein
MQTQVSNPTSGGLLWTFWFRRRQGTSWLQSDIVLLKDFAPWCWLINLTLKLRCWIEKSLRPISKFAHYIDVPKKCIHIVPPFSVSVMPFDKVAVALWSPRTYSSAGRGTTEAPCQSAYQRDRRRQLLFPRQLCSADTAVISSHALRKWSLLLAIKVIFQLHIAL